MARTFTCGDCGASGTAAARGPVPKRCDPCRALAKQASRRRTASAPPVAPTDMPDALGPVLIAVWAAVEARRKAGLDEIGEARAALALNLAATLDAGAGMAAAAVARELRATLTELAPTEEDGGDDDPFDRLVADLSAPDSHTSN